MTAEDGVPQLRVVRGEPNDVELAALVAGLLASSAGPLPEPDPALPGGWADHARWLRGAGDVRRGANAWRWSLRS
jgi:hypothetical protein